MSYRNVQNEVFKRARYKIEDGDPALVFLAIADHQASRQTLYSTQLASLIESNRLQRAKALNEIKSLQMECLELRQTVADLRGSKIRRLSKTIAEIYRSATRFFQGDPGGCSIDSTFDPATIRISNEDLTTIEDEIFERQADDNVKIDIDENESHPMPTEIITIIGARIKLRTEEKRK